MKFFLNNHNLINERRTVMISKMSWKSFKKILINSHAMKNAFEFDQDYLEQVFELMKTFSNTNITKHKKSQKRMNDWIIDKGFYYNESRNLIIIITNRNSIPEKFYANICDECNKKDREISKLKKEINTLHNSII